MPTGLNKRIIRSKPLRTTLIFCAAFVILSIIWLQIRGAYGYLITFLASKLVAGAKDARLEDITIGRGFLTAGFTSLKRPGIYVDVPVNLAVYTTNVPLTLSMLLSLHNYIGRRLRAYAEALTILFAFHLLYVSLYAMLQLTNAFMTKGLERPGLIQLSNYHFLWGLAEHASMSFAPFLIVFYTYLRFRKP